MIERFDATRHTIESFSIGLPYDPKGIRLMEEKEGEYRCSMRVLLAGDHDIGWGEKIRVLPEDVALCVGNGKKRIDTDFMPVLFDHGWTARGTEGGGEVIDLYEEAGDFWLGCDLDEETYRGACKPGKKWKSRSLGFGAWRDADGFLRPADPYEISLTNLPRLKGLGKVVSMSALWRELAGVRPGAVSMTPSGLVIPNASGRAAGSPPDGASSAAATDSAGRSLSTRITSPATASDRKDTTMKLSPETLKRLDLAENASEDDVNKALLALADKADAAKPQGAAAVPAVPAATPEAVPDVAKLAKEAVATAMKDVLAEHATQLAEATAKAEKKARIDGLLARAVGLGKLLRSDVDLFRPSVETNPDAFEARMATMPKVAPVDPVFEKGGDATGLSGAGATPADRSAHLTYVAQLARRMHIPVSRAEALLAAQGGN